MTIEDPRFKRVNVIGVPITATNMDDCLALVEERLDDMRGEYVCVSNAHTCVMAHDDPAYWAVQAESVMSVPDGKPLSVVGSKEVPTMGRVTGPDLMRALLDRSQRTGWSHYLYGDTPEHLVALLGALTRNYPKARIAGAEPSVFRPLSLQEKAELAERVNTSGADLMWVAIGAPRQEVLCRDLKGCTNALMVGVGGAFNVLAGVVPEAPQWMQLASLEWLYRLIQEPKRLFKRYLTTNIKFIAYQIMHAKRREGTS